MVDLEPAPPVEPADDREVRRQEALEAYGVLDEHHASRAELHSLVALAAAASGVPKAAINLLTEDEQHQIEAVGFEGAVSARADSLCSVVIDDPEPVVLRDARDDPRFQDNPWVTGPASVRFYATFQLRTPAKVAVGSLCLFDSRPRVVSESDQQLLQVLAARVTDVLELELQSRRWQAAVRELERTNARLVDFAATVSHDLRGPLATVEMALEILADQLEDSAGPGPEASFGTRDLLARARRSTERMSGTIGHLLAESRMSDTDALRMTSWRRVAGDALEDLGSEIRGLVVRLDADDALVRCRPVGLRLVLQNILANAARYAGPTDPRIEVCCRPVDGGSEILVVDHGPGVPPADRHRIFAPHQRGSGSANDAAEVVRRADGHGLGLATAHRLVAEMGGHLELRETPGGGATFAVTLPDA